MVCSGEGTAQVVFWLLCVGHGGTIGGYSNKACNPSFCLWGWPALLLEVCSQLLDTGVVFLMLSVSSSLHSTAVRFWNLDQYDFCSSSWVPSSERRSVLSVSLSVDLHRSSGCPRLR